jgi:alkanesulfonate monooxygenase SsuD/methylene tetrahydromethanopterin reductase-like flavin-dependent oxidoreductase (luciferase family)
MVSQADEMGFHHVRIVEHYFHRYGGYSPNPIVFLSAAAQRSRRLKLITGAVLPAFNHPLKLAGEIGMLDAISKGRLEVGFARAFLPHEFGRFGVSLDESRARSRKGIETVRRLLEDEDVSHKGTLSVDHFSPRPTQSRGHHSGLLRVTEQSFVFAGRRDTASATDAGAKVSADRGYIVMRGGMQAIRVPAACAGLPHAVS